MNKRSNGKFQVNTNSSNEQKSISNKQKNHSKKLTKNK